MALDARESNSSDRIAQMRVASDQQLGRRRFRRVKKAYPYEHCVAMRSPVRRAAVAGTDARQGSPNAVGDLLMDLLKAGA